MTAVEQNEGANLKSLTNNHKNHLMNHSVSKHDKKNKWECKAML